MKTVLFFSLFVIWNVFGVEGEFDGSPRIKAMKVKDITSAEMCAGACQSKADMSILDCLIWRYNKKTKRCIINFVKAKPNRKSTFGFPSSAQTTLPPPPPPFTCPEGWPEYEGSCYKLQTNKTYWNDAKTNCRSFEGGDLASIHNEDEWAFVEGLMEAEYNLDSNMTIYWLGGRYGEWSDGRYWKWSDGSAWGNFTFWPGMPPAGSGDYSGCLGAFQDIHEEYEDIDWLWFSYGCTDPQYISPYVCKIQG